jgi:hypothetical protein
MLRRKESEDPVEMGRQQKSMGPYRSAISDVVKGGGRFVSGYNSGLTNNIHTLERRTHCQMRLLLGCAGVSESSVTTRVNGDSDSISQQSSRRMTGL